MGWRLAWTTLSHWTQTQGFSFQFKTRQGRRYPLPRCHGTRNKIQICFTHLKTWRRPLQAPAAHRKKWAKLLRAWSLQILASPMPLSQLSFTPTVHLFCPVPKSSIGLSLRSRTAVLFLWLPKAVKETWQTCWIKVQIQSVPSNLTSSITFIKTSKLRRRKGTPQFKMPTRAITVQN